PPAPAGRTLALATPKPRPPVDDHPRIGWARVRPALPGQLPLEPVPTLGAPLTFGGHVGPLAIGGDDGARHPAVDTNDSAGALAFRHHSLVLQDDPPLAVVRAPDDRVADQAVTR